MLIGGDHSAAAGYWSGIAQAHQPRGDIGLVWIDAHMDSHTPFTSPNGYVHGMPLAALLGHGDPGLTGLLSPRAKLRPDRVCLIGTRDFEPEEAALLRTLDVRVFYMDEVRSRAGTRSGRRAGDRRTRARRLRRHTGPGRHRTRRCPGSARLPRTGCAATRCFPAFAACCATAAAWAWKFRSSILPRTRMDARWTSCWPW